MPFSKSHCCKKSKFSNQCQKEQTEDEQVCECIKDMVTSIKNANTLELQNQTEPFISQASFFDSTALVQFYTKVLAPRWAKGNFINMGVGDGEPDELIVDLRAEAAALGHSNPILDNVNELA